MWRLAGVVHQRVEGRALGVQHGSLRTMVRSWCDVQVVAMQPY